jgi:predicted transcriptional regulator
MTPQRESKNLDKVTQDVEVANRNYKGFNFFSHEDLDLLLVLSKGEYNINGLRNQFIRQHLSWSPGKLSRILKRLRVHGLIKKVGGTYKYYLTKLGKKAIITGLY